MNKKQFQDARSLDLLIRARRLRSSQALRDLVAETYVKPSDLIMPFFIQEGHNQEIPIKSLLGQHRFSIDRLLIHAENALKYGVKGIALFPKTDEKNKNIEGSYAAHPKGLVQEAIKQLKKHLPELLIFSDIALDPYTTTGQDGIVINDYVHNDITVDALIAQALSHADAGADFVAPSDMMDGRIGAIRMALDEAGFENVGILSYAAKYASHLYGPFRDALESAPKKGDKKTYQMDFRNAKEAIREASLDIEEGADIIMVKPATFYLDIIKDLYELADIPIAAYQVSGEYAMIKYAGESGLTESKDLMNEALTSIKRAGAKIIYTYAALEFSLEYYNSKKFL